MAKIDMSGEHPKCPVCGSHRFDTTLELISAGNWEVENITCLGCETKIEVTEDLKKWLRGEKWEVKQG